jgi:hypothetical protein
MTVWSNYWMTLTNILEMMLKVAAGDPIPGKMSEITGCFKGKHETL